MGSRRENPTSRVSAVGWHLCLGCLTRTPEASLRLLQIPTVDPHARNPSAAPTPHCLSAFLPTLPLLSLLALLSPFPGSTAHPSSAQHAVFNPARHCTAYCSGNHALTSDPCLQCCCESAAGSAATTAAAAGLLLLACRCYCCCYYCTSAVGARHPSKWHLHSCRF